jgi:malate dehydrogenase (oxaloacetate-decarboxylating)(NADP+)
VPGQGNNAYIFPGVGLGAIVSGARRVTDEMFAAAARTLAADVSEADLALGRIYPSLDRIREVSARIAAAVAEVAYSRDLARHPRPRDLDEVIWAGMFEPDYASALPG